MNKSMWKSIIVLASICLVIAAVLAAVNGVTAPIIEKNAERAKQEALAEVMPGATGFTAVERTDAMPETVTEVYRENDGRGFVFVVKAPGYQGKNNPMTVIVGVAPNGEITRCVVTDVSGESAGIGDKVAGAGFLSSFEGKDSETLSGVPLLSGATISSGGFRSGIADALTAFDLVKEAN